MKINNISVNLASEIITSGGVVAFPTETVYGLGVSAYMGENVKKVYEIKGRPSDNPLIVHVGDVKDITLAASEVTQTAKALLKAFAPGPITVVLNKNEKIAKEVSAGLDTVGIRIPSHEGARTFLKACNVPVAAPSANTSTRPSPTTARDVFADIGGKVPLILDGGKCLVGIESTVVDCRGEVPIILRAGKITKADIEKVCGQCLVSGATSEVRSPGVKYKHYSPKCKMKVSLLKSNEYVQKEVLELTRQGEKVVLIGEKKLFDIKKCEYISLGENVCEFMQNYYEALRLGEKMGTLIYCVIPFTENEAEGLYNRVMKSCGGEII